MRHASPYCFDPNCESCKELRKAFENIRAGASIPSSGEAIPVKKQSKRSVAS
jgi:hypothetical protein